MSSLLRRAALAVLLSAVAGCSSVGGTNDSALSTTSGKKVAGDSSVTTSKNAATLHVSQYIDQRQVGNPRFLGQITTRVNGVSGNELIMDQDIAVIATAAIKKRFDAEGFQVQEGSDAINVLFEVSGVIKELLLNVKNRDEISISIETTLKDAATGKVVWSGLVTEKNDRFAGVSGNNKADVDAFLNKGLRVVSGKTVEAISASLMAARPELFTLTPGTKAIKGVDVYVAPAVAPSIAVTQPAMPAPVQADTSPANFTTGLLSVKTNPPRAKVYLDGVYFGLSPLRSEIEPGVHDVVVSLKGYKTVTEKVSVRKGDNTELELSLER
ncbi:MAG: PEGA domain-containing protein [Gallionella sp.]|nr:PEGA domain-containing protein [Gallionella sp.]